MKKFKKGLKNEQAIKYFHGSYFWDCIKEEIKLKSDYQIVIERVLSRTANNFKVDLSNLDKFYCKSLIKQLAVKAEELRGNEIIEYLSIRYNLSPEDFKTYFKYNT